MKRSSRLAAIALLAPVALMVMSGCTATIALEPAADAINPACAAVVVHLPDSVGDQPERQTNAQGTGAWGDPSSVLLRCGVDVPAPSTLPCVLVGSVYWLRDELGGSKYSFTTYGRDPAVQVIVDRETVTPGPALFELENAVSFTPSNGRECSSIEDSLNPSIPTATPTAAPSGAPTN